MRLAEMYFTDWYHKYVTIEVDDLTEDLKQNITIHDDDCYVLCSSYCDENGLVFMNVLAVGSTWENSTRGLKYKKMLGTYSIDMVLQCEARLVEPDYSMIHKNEEFLKKMDEGIDDDLLETRKDARLDLLRDPFYPDVVMTGLIQGESLSEYAMRITGIKGPFLTGVIAEEPAENIGIHIDDAVYALLYMNNNEYRLFGLFAGDSLNEDEKEAMDRIIQETDKLGIDFNGISIKS